MDNAKDQSTPDWRKSLNTSLRDLNFPDGFKELDIEIDRPSGRVFVKDGTNIMNYIKEGKVWVLK